MTSAACALPWIWEACAAPGVGENTTVGPAGAGPIWSLVGLTTCTGRWASRRHARWFFIFTGLSTRPRLASLEDPAGVVGWTLTAPHPVKASAANATAVSTLLSRMRGTKVEDHCDRASVRRPQRTASQA